MPRIYAPCALRPDQALRLPAAASRHVQVLRLQPGDALTLFNGEGGEYSATVTRMGRSEVDVQLHTHDPMEREAAIAIHLAVGMPANERMDWLVEKATELGAASVQPLMTAHSVLRLKGERAEKKQAHWQAQAIAACEQCGRNRVPVIHPVAELESWLKAPLPTLTPSLGSDAQGHEDDQVAQPLPPLRLVLSLAAQTQPLSHHLAAPALRSVWLLNGPEGGLSAAEDAQARAAAWQPTTLGARILRAETAALAALAALTNLASGSCTNASH
ncbi:MAG: hypothetical protein RLZZ612_2195 [Pseudomonadota bacterium]|jgi:16S rRNA (uracil1498-N3)-methyltransferase